MHLTQAYRSLPRPSSLIKPSHPPIGVFAPAQVYYIVCIYIYYYSDNLLVFCPCLQFFYCKDDDLFAIYLVPFLLFFSCYRGK